MQCNEETRKESRAKFNVQLKSFKLFVTVFLGCKAALLFLLAYNTSFITDEFRHGGAPFFIKEGFYEKIIPVKTVLYAYFYNIANQLSDDSFTIMLIAREQTVFLCFATLCILYLIARNIGRKHLEALFILCVIFSFSTFVERIFRVRSEPLALFLAAISLLLVSDKRQTASKLIVAGIFNGASFLTTQKAIYFNIALGVALVVNELLDSSVRSAVNKGFLLLGGWCSALFFYCLFFRGIYFYEVIPYIFTRSITLHFHAATYYSLAGFIGQTVTRNLIPYFLGLFGWLFTGKNILRIKGPERIVWLFSGMITIFIFSHNQPWPYIFVFCIPFISIWSDRPLAFVKAFGERKYLIAVITTMVLLSFSFFRNFHYIDLNNRLQRKVVMQAQRLLKPHEFYCDGIGMVVNRPRIFNSWWDTPKIYKILRDTKNGHSRDIEEIFSKQPKIWILNWRTEKLKEVLDPYFANSYLQILPNIMVTGIEVISSEETKFINRWYGKYRLFSSEGQPINGRFSVNGRTISGTVQIPLGENLVKLEAPPTSAYLLPADTNVPFKRKMDIKQIPLFENVYDY
jgi:hypothetical protein